MCDYSLQSIRSRPAKVGDRLVTRDFGTGTRGFAAVDDLETAICLLPGTELAFAREVTHYSGLTAYPRQMIGVRPPEASEQGQGDDPS
jgi:hypothetical protein